MRKILLAIFIVMFVESMLFSSTQTQEVVFDPEDLEIVNVNQDDFETRDELELYWFLTSYNLILQGKGQGGLLCFSDTGEYLAGYSTPGTPEDFFLDLPPSTLSIPAPVQGRWAVEIDKLQQALKGKEVTVSYDGALVVQAGHMVSRIPLMEPEDCPKVPNIEYTAHATILASDLRAVVRETDGKKVPFIALTIDEQGVTVESRDEMGYGQTLAVPPEECLDLTVESPARATFGTDMMQRFLKNVPNDAEISLDMSKDYPMRISLAGEGWTSEWVCAPVIQSD